MSRWLQPDILRFLAQVLLDAKSTPDPYCVTILFVLALTIRARLNNIQAYSPADETIYARISQGFLASRPWRMGPEMSRGFLANMAEWPAPPQRFGMYWLSALLCRLQPSKEVTPRKLAWISTFFGASTIPLAFLVARANGLALWPSIAAALLVTTSPINLGMSRRALHETMVAGFAVLGYLAASTGCWYWTAASLTALLFAKEVSLLAFPGLLLLFASHLLDNTNGAPWTAAIIPCALAFGLPVILYCLAVAAFTNLGLHDLARMMKLMVPQDGYTKSYERGPVHTYLLQFALLSPVLAILLARTWTWTPLSVAVAINVVILSISTKKNYRTFTTSDVMLRIVAAASLAAYPTSTAVALVTMCVTADALMFRKVFLKKEVYDPVMHSMAKALDMVP
jgi:hypothetical protein